MGSEMFAISQADDAINAVALAHLGIRLDGVDNWSGVGEAGGFKEDGVKVFAAGGELAERADKIPTDGAADAAVVHCDKIFRCI